MLNILVSFSFIFKGSTLGDLNPNSPIMKRIQPSSRSRTSLCKNVFDAFHSLASPPNCLWQDINTMMGFNLDGEAVFEVSTLKPLGPIQVKMSFFSLKDGTSFIINHF